MEDLLRNAIVYAYDDDTPSVFSELIVRSDDHPHDHEVLVALTHRVRELQDMVMRSCVSTSIIVFFAVAYLTFQTCVSMHARRKRTIVQVVEPPDFAVEGKV